MTSGEEKKGFTIRDRRFSSQEEAPAREERAEGTPGAKGPTPGGEAEPGPGSEVPLTEINFSSFIFSLSTSVLLHLGEVADPLTQKQEKNLPMAKQTIDILGMLKEKTKGNLTPDEERMIDTLLADLRWRYIREADK